MYMILKSFLTVLKYTGNDMWVDITQDNNIYYNIFVKMDFLLVDQLFER